MANKKYWLMKSEPEEFSIDDLERKGTEFWTGVRNYQARNFMMRDMDLGDDVLFYHSNAEPSGVAGLATIIRLAEPDILQFDKKSDYYDPKATKENPIWFCVEVQFKAKAREFYSLEQIKKDKALAKMLVVKKGMRLSIQPVDKKDFDHILKKMEISHG